MPYSIDHKNKCVYKKNSDGTRGEKVGCTKGSLKSYVAALQIHAESKQYIKKKLIKEMDDQKNPEIVEPIDGAITQIYAVQKPYAGCELTSLVQPIDPLLGIGAGHTVVSDQVHALFADEHTAQKIATELYEDYIEKQAALEEKKDTTAKKIKSTVDALEKKRKEHMDAAKEDPKNASKHRQEIAVLANKIDDLMTKLEKIEKSKKSIEEKLDEGFFDRLKASIKGTGAQASTTFGNFKAFLKGDKAAIKDPVLAKNMAVLQQKAKTLDAQLADVMKDISKLFPKETLEKAPVEFKNILSNYTTLLDKTKVANNSISTGNVASTTAPAKVPPPPPPPPPPSASKSAPPKSTTAPPKSTTAPANKSGVKANPNKPLVPSKDGKTTYYGGVKYSIQKDDKGMFIKTPKGAIRLKTQQSKDVIKEIGNTSNVHPWVLRAMEELKSDLDFYLGKNNQYAGSSIDFKLLKSKMNDLVKMINTYNKQ
jgi:hypothetical protein